MMRNLKKYIKKQIYIELGKNSFYGVVTDLGEDILVLFNGIQYIYMPVDHINHIQFNTNQEKQVDQPIEDYLLEQIETLSLLNVLITTKEWFTEIHVAGNFSFYGYITEIYDDYFSFYSSMYKQMYISLNHLKWLAPLYHSHSPKY